MEFCDTPEPFELRKEGLFFKPANVYIDPRRPVQNALISHAHADHSSNGIQQAWATPETLSLIKLRLGKRAPLLNHGIKYHQPFNLSEGTQVTFLPAGHMLGSAMILIQHNDTRYLYTGDFKLTSDPTCEKADIVPCDVLFTEVTFGAVKYSHPEPEAEIRKLHSYLPGRLVISCYKQGKSQRITRMIHELDPEIQLMVHPEIVQYHKCYESLGVDLGSWEQYNRRTFLNSTSAVLIAPPSRAIGFTTYPGVVVAKATGWKRFIPKMGFHLHISDHVDIDEMMHFIDRSQAKKIVTFHGDDKELKFRVAARAQLKLNF